MGEKHEKISENLIAKGTIQETMLGPLWARANYSKLYPEMLKDDMAFEIIEKVDYDFSETKEFLTGKNDFRALGLLVRSKQFDNALLKYMEKYPQATIVNIGAGLDTTFFRVDNGKIKWYNLDLPNAIEYRKQFIKEGPRNKCISNSALDFNWFNEVEWSEEDGIFFIIGGLTYYFKEEDLRKLFLAMVGHFSGGEIVFDVMSKLAIKKFNQLAKKMGKDEVVYFSVKNPESIFPQWSDKIQVLDWFPIWSRTKINQNWNKRTIKMIKLTRRLKTSKIVLLKFQ